MAKPLLVTLTFGALGLGACNGGTTDAPAPSASPSRAQPVAASSPAATPPPPPSASSEPAKAGAPIPEIDPKLPVEKLDLAAYSKKTKEERAALVGRKLRLKGAVHSVSDNAMIFDQKQALWGPEKHGAANGVYAIELHGKKAPNETWSKETATCFVDEKTQQELSAVFFGNTIQLEVEGVVDRTFNDLAPCRVISKKVVKN